MAFLRITSALSAALFLTLMLLAQQAGSVELEKQYTVKGFEHFRWELLPAEGELTLEDGVCLLRNETNQKLILLSASRVRDIAVSVDLVFSGRERSWAGILLDYNYYADLDSASYTHIVLYSDGKLSVGRTARDAPQEDQSGIFPLNRKHPRRVSLNIFKLRDRLRVIVNGEKMDYRLPEGEEMGNFGMLLAPYREVSMSNLELTVYHEPDFPFKGIKYKDIFGDPGATF
jgi:hypothetical protein